MAVTLSSRNTTGSVPALENIVLRTRTRWALDMDSSILKRQLAVGYVREIIVESLWIGSDSQHAGCQLE